MWIEDPIALAQCVSLEDLTVRPEVIKSRLQMMERQGHLMWDDVLTMNKILFLPINYPPQEHWITGKSYASHL